MRVAHVREGALRGKQYPDFEALLGAETINIQDALTGNIDWCVYDLIILAFSDEVPESIKRFQKLVPMIKTSGVIFNNPVICDIGHKVDSLKHAHGVPYINVPKYSMDLLAVDFFPCILKMTRGTTPEGIEADQLLHNRVDLVAARNKRHNQELYAVQFIENRRDDGYHASVRFRIIGDRVVSWVCRPSRDWSVHMCNTSNDMLRVYHDMFSKYIKTIDIQQIGSGIAKNFGLGFYVMDCVWAPTGLWFCEIGYKINDGAALSTMNRKQIPYGKPYKNDVDVFQEAKEIILSKVIK